jgi:hypothetical protein
MTRERLWEAYVKKNPKFGDPDAVVSLTSRGLKKLFDQTWDYAEASAYPGYEEEPHGRAPITADSLEKLQCLKEMFGFR